MKHSDPIVKLPSAFVIIIGILLSAPGFASEAASHAPKIDLDVGIMSGFVSAGSAVQVRENNIEGTRLPFRDLGIHTVQIPRMDSTFWINQRSALALRLRYFSMTGSRRLPSDVNFNGATLAAGQTLHTKPNWTSVGIFYKRQWNPTWLKRGNLRGLAGIEATFIDFRISGGHAKVTPASAGTETKEGFMVQELPIPTVGLEFQQQVLRNAVLEMSISGNWINHWNSLRKEGGTIYLSQREFESHLDLRFKDNARFKSWHPMFGLFYYDFRQLEVSREDGNFIEARMLGPEIGIGMEF